VGLLAAYAILIQALTTPFLRTEAAELARLDGTLAILCFGGMTTDHDTPEGGKSPGGHGLDCCLPGARPVVLDVPALVPASLAFGLPEALPGYRLVYALVQGRAPPASLTAVLQPRAPPISIV